MSASADHRRRAGRRALIAGVGGGARAVRGRAGSGDGDHRRRPCLPRARRRGWRHWRVAGRAAPRSPPSRLVLYRAAGRRFDLDWAFLAAIGAQECRHGSCAGDNGSGCAGPMQIAYRRHSPCSPGEGPTCGSATRLTATATGARDIDDPADAIFTAARILREAKGAPAVGGSRAAYRRAACNYYGACSDPVAHYADEVMARAIAYGLGRTSNATQRGSDDGCGALLGSALPVADGGFGAVVRLRAPRQLAALPDDITTGRPVRCDARIVDDVIWLARRFHVRVTACYAIHSPAGEHPLGAADRPRPCSRAARGRTRPRRSRAPPAGTRTAPRSGVAPGCARPPFRFIGYNGYPGHGDPAHCGCGAGAHLHLSWQTSASARPAGEPSAQLVLRGELDRRLHHGRPGRRAMSRRGRSSMACGRLGGSRIGSLAGSLSPSLLRSLCGSLRDPHATARRSPIATGEAPACRAARSPSPSTFPARGAAVGRDRPSDRAAALALGALAAGLAIAHLAPPALEADPPSTLRSVLRTLPRAWPALILALAALRGPPGAGGAGAARPRSPRGAPQRGSRPQPRAGAPARRRPGTRAPRRSAARRARRAHRDHPRRRRNGALPAQRPRRLTTGTARGAHRLPRRRAPRPTANAQISRAWAARGALRAGARAPRARAAGRRGPARRPAWPDRRRHEPPERGRRRACHCRPGRPGRLSGPRPQAASPDGSPRPPTRQTQRCDGRQRSRASEHAGNGRAPPRHPRPGPQARPRRGPRSSSNSCSPSGRASAAERGVGDGARCLRPSMRWRPTTTCASPGCASAAWGSWAPTCRGAEGVRPAAARPRASRRAGATSSPPRRSPGC